MSQLNRLMHDTGFRFGLSLCAFGIVSMIISLTLIGFGTTILPQVVIQLGVLVLTSAVVNTYMQPTAKIELELSPDDITLRSIVVFIGALFFATAYGVFCVTTLEMETPIAIYRGLFMLLFEWSIYAHFHAKNWTITVFLTVISVALLALALFFR